MAKKIPFKIRLTTDGRGLWSDVSKSVRTLSLQLITWGDTSYGELRVFFHRTDWCVHRFHGSDGLIYTDPRWLRELKQALRREYGFSEKAVRSIDYSEQGMQGDNYVSLDVGKTFMVAWENAFE